MTILHLRFPAILLLSLNGLIHVYSVDVAQDDGADSTASGIVRPQTHISMSSKLEDETKVEQAELQEAKDEDEDEQFEEYEEEEEDEEEDEHFEEYEEEEDGDEDEEERDLYQDCRRHPHWTGHLSEDCPELTGWKPVRQEWWEDHAFRDLDNYTDPMNDCVEKEFLDFMETWPDCDLEENFEDPLCHVYEPEVTSTLYHEDEGELITVEMALSPQEGFAVQAVARCIRQVFPNELPYFEKRAFGAEDSEITNNYLESGNICTFISGYMQLFVPGVVAQVTKILTLVWQEVGWEEKGMLDPRNLGIRTMEHLSYETTSKLGVHEDEGSNYTVLITLSDPDDFGGGEYRLDSNHIKFKPPPLTALIFESDTPHGVNPVLTGRRETFATEFWEYFDVTIDMPRCDMADSKEFAKEYEEFLEASEEEEDEEDSEDAPNDVDEGGEVQEDGIKDEL